MKTFALWMCVGAVLLASGCTSSLKYSQQLRKVTITSDPEGALVYQLNPSNESERIFLGTTPLKEQTVLVPTKVDDYGTTSSYAAKSQLEMVRVVLEKDGYKPFNSNLSTAKDETMRHDCTLEPK
jgi:hypothetical protein